MRCRRCLELPLKSIKAREDAELLESRQRFEVVSICCLSLTQHTLMYIAEKRTPYSVIVISLRHTKK